MILPPFYGGVASHLVKDKSWYRMRSTYLNQDILYFKIPSKTAVSTYLSLDALMYDLPFTVGPLRASYVNFDTLLFSIPDAKLKNSYLNIDALYYNPPPEAPEIPTNVYALAGDSTVDLSWNRPYDNRSSITDYHIQYSISGVGGFSPWENFDDPVSAVTGVYIDQLVNGVNYQFRVAAINSIGTGDYGYSNIVNPSPGDSRYCTLLSYLPLDIDYLDKSCVSGTVSGLYQEPSSLSITSSSYKYGGSSLFLDGQPHSVLSPYSSEEYPMYVDEYPHLEIGYNQNINWNLSGDFTIEMFVKPLTSIINDTLFIIRNPTPDFGAEYTTDNYLKLYRLNNSIKFEWNLSFYDFDAEQYINSNQQITANNVNLPTNDWTHLSVIRYNNIIKLYINGIASGNTINSSVPMNLSGLHINIGANIGDMYYEGTRSSQGFGGYIDQLIMSKAAKYKNNFTPAEYTLTKECNC